MRAETGPKPKPKQKGTWSFHVSMGTTTQFLVPSFLQWQDFYYISFCVCKLGQMCVCEQSFDVLVLSCACALSAHCV